MSTTTMHDCRTEGCTIPKDCTCTILPGHHTQAAPNLSVETLRSCLEQETCPAEQRALLRLIEGMNR